MYLTLLTQWFKATYNTLERSFGDRAHAQTQANKNEVRATERSVRARKSK